MKKLRYTFVSLFTVLLLFCAFQISASAYNVGYSKYSNVVTYINHYPIPSWNYKGQTLICVEDLKDYGFEIKWNEYKKTINITRNDSMNISPVVTFRPKKSLIGKNQLMLKSTDSSVWYWNYRITAYGGLDGYTLINVADLACINNVSVKWVPSVNAVKVWVTDGLEMNASPWNIKEYDPNMKYYDTCATPSGCTYDVQYFSSPSILFLSYAQFDNASGEYCTCPYGHLYITDVIDSNGNSRKKTSYANIYGDVKGTNAAFSNIPYFYDVTDFELSALIAIDSDDLLPSTASDKGGIIKYCYTCQCGSKPVEDEIRVDRLPD